MPTVSTKDRATHRPDEHAGPDPAEAEISGRVELARRRIADGYYDRAEVRRTVASLLLKRLARPRG
ncbi:MAG TPA: hypothetical protein VLT84_01955 [Acidobacteriota bacterium]|nr:hypothetical protein [Acidobacteriota bacterium]